MIRAVHNLLVTDAGKTSRQALGVLISTLVIVAGSFVGILLARERPVLVFLDNLHWTGAYTAGAWLAWIGFASASPENRVPRCWFALGLSAYAMGQWVWNVQIAIGHNPFPGPSDLFFLGLGPCCVFGL